jgi:[protein-PII] uridylyltransferase
VGLLWDCGLEPGHSVRTVAECLEEAAKDVTVDTSLLESRYVAGNAALVGELGARLGTQRNVRDFFEAKIQEQMRRYEALPGRGLQPRAQHQGEPRGLRDLHVVLWLARAAGLGRSWKELAEQGLITSHEAGASPRTSACWRTCGSACTTWPAAARTAWCSTTRSRSRAS